MSFSAGVRGFTTGMQTDESFFVRSTVLPSRKFVDKITFFEPGFPLKLVGALNSVVTTDTLRLEKNLMYDIMFFKCCF